MAQPKYPIARLVKPIVTWFGRLGRPNAPSASFRSSSTRDTSFSTSDTSTTGKEIKTDQQFWEMFFTPYVWAGIRYRDVSRLWTGAGPTYNQDGDQTSNAQIIAKDIDGQEIDSPQLQACRWLFDQRLEQGSITALLKEISYSKLLLKKSVHEILWVREDNPDYGVKVVLNGFKHVDPTLFEFNPQGYEPGLYIQKVNEYGNKTVLYEKVDKRRFLVVTNHELFADKNGISELEPLRKAEPRREDAEKSWGRGAQRHGHGHVLGKYGNQLLGNAGSTDRANFEEMLKEMGTDTVSMTYEGNTIEQLNVDVKSEVFKDFISELKQQISVVLTGSATTFTDEAGGTKARLETSEKAQESELEQQDCADISAAITEQVLWRFCDYNWLDTDVYPKIQIITEEVIAPTMPETQDTQTEILGDEELEQKEEPEEEVVKESLNRPKRYELPTPLWIDSLEDELRGVKKFQEETPEPSIPVAVPAGYKDFPNTEPLSPEYRDALDYVHTALAQIEVKEYEDVQPGEGANIFTAKRFRGYTSDMLPILTALKAAIDITLDENSELDAWNQYFELATVILKNNGINMDPGIRNDLNISFRQTRQRALNNGYILMSLDDPDVVGFEIVPDKNVSQHHLDEIAWYGKVIPKDHVEMQAGGRLRPPLNFGCLCKVRAVKNAALITPESEWPVDYPGKTYRYYAQPRPRE